MKFLLIQILLLALLGSCKEKKVSKVPPIKPLPKADTSLTDVLHRGKLIALSRYNSSSYFIFRGEPMGFEYELLHKYASHLGVDLEIKVPTSKDSLLIYLNQGAGDLIAANLKVTREAGDKVLFAEHHNTTRQVLVQRRPNDWRNSKIHEIDKKLIKDPLELLGEKVSLPKHSHYIERVDNLMDELGGEIEIDTVSEDLEAEDLIRKVAQGEITYTIADENVAHVMSGLYANIDVSTPISFRQRLAWATKKESFALKESIDEWMRGLKASGNPEYFVIYNKYFRNKKAYMRRQKSELFALHSGKISPYDSLFQQLEDTLFSWTLFASMAYQESRFDPDKESWAGAKGVMQILPVTAEQLGIQDIEDPEENIRGAVKYLRDIHKRIWKDLEKEESIRFSLASYNAGIGHVRDAQRLVVKYGGQEGSWEDVAQYLIKLQEEEFYYDPLVEHGYCNGDETVNYVNEIIERERIYKDILRSALIDSIPNL